NRSELIAILAAGFGKETIYSLVIASSLVAASFQFINVGYLDPWSKKFEQEVENEDFFSVTQGSIAGKVWYKSKGYYASFSVFDQDKNELKDLTLYFFDETDLGTRIVKAKQATYVGAQEWKLSHGTIWEQLSSQNFPVVE